MPKHELLLARESERPSAKRDRALSRIADSQNECIFYIWPCTNESRGNSRLRQEFAPLAVSEIGIGRKQGCVNGCPLRPFRIRDMVENSAHSLDFPRHSEKERAHQFIIAID